MGSWSLRRLAAAVLLAAMPAAAMAEPDIAALRQQVLATERAFAKTMADRDFKAFAAFVAEDTVWFSGAKPLRGREAVLQQWKRFYEKPQAPFSWEPDQVEVLADGSLAHSSGPVRDASGRPVGRFNSVWRQEAPGVWRVVFDRGEPACECTGQGTGQGAGEAAKEPAKPAAPPVSAPAAR